MLSLSTYLKNKDENSPPPSTTTASSTTTTTSLKKEVIFRGDWAPTLDVPLKWGFQGLKFIPIAAPVEPSGKIVEIQQQQQPTPVNDNELKKHDCPPPGVEVLFEIHDRNFEYRGCIAKDGCCTNAYYQIIGYVSGNQAGSASERYLGRVQEIRWDNQYQVWAASLNEDVQDEDLIAMIDMGTCSVKRKDGGTAFDIKTGGKILHPNGTQLGQFKGMRGYHELETVVLYLLLIDPTFTADDGAPYSV
jgi:hypothetical protein